jgi:hypothetical protein
VAAGGGGLGGGGHPVVAVVVGWVGPLLGLEIDPASGWGRGCALNRVAEAGIVLGRLCAREGRTPDQGVVESGL